MTDVLIRFCTAAVILVLSACAQIPEVCEECSSPWISTNKNSVFVRPDKPGYDAYAAWKYKMLGEAKYFPEWVDEAQRTILIDAVAPRRHTPAASQCAEYKTRGVILVHGLFDTPFIMRDLARQLKSKCYVVYDVLLTGHGTRPGDLLNVKRNEWKREIEYVVSEVEKEVGELYVGGFSLGGALSLHVAGKFDSVKGVLLFAPALIPTNRAAYGSLPVTLFSGRYFKVFAEYDFAKYESLPHRAGSETYLLGAEVRKYLKRGFAKPLFVAVSLEDDTIDARYTVRSVHAQGYNRMLIFAANTDEASTLCEEYEQRNGDKSCRSVQAAVGRAGIRSLSHVGLMVDPENRHYGLDGDYRHCLYAKSNMRLCLEAEINKSSCDKNILCYGESIRPTDKPVIRRITFNPKYATLISEIARFLDKLEN